MVHIWALPRQKLSTKVPHCTANEVSTDTHVIHSCHVVKQLTLIDAPGARQNVMIASPTADLVSLPGALPTIPASIALASTSSLHFPQNCQQEPGAILLKRKAADPLCRTAQEAKSPRITSATSFHNSLTLPVAEFKRPDHQANSAAATKAGDVPAQQIKVGSTGMRAFLSSGISLADRKVW